MGILGHIDLGMTVSHAPESAVSSISIHSSAWPSGLSEPASNAALLASKSSGHNEPEMPVLFCHAFAFSSFGGLYLSLIFSFRTFCPSSVSQ